MSTSVKSYSLTNVIDKWQRVSVKMCWLTILEYFNVQQWCCENLQSRSFQGSDDGLTEILFWHVWSDWEKQTTVRTAGVLVQIWAVYMLCTSLLNTISYFPANLMPLDLFTLTFRQRIQINQPTRCNIFSSLLLDVYLQLNMFWASSRPSSGAQQLQ